MRKPTGHIRPHGAGYEAAVPVGRDPITKRYSYAYRQARTLQEAEKVRDRMLAGLEAGRGPRDKTTFGQLLDDVLEVAHLDLSTRGLPGYIERTIQPALDPLLRHVDVPRRPASSPTRTACPAPTGNGSRRWPCCAPGGPGT